MRKYLVFISILIMSLVVKNYHAFCAVTSYDNVFVAGDVFASDFHTRLNDNFTESLTGGINNINAANIVDDSLTEAEMADEINPRVRTYEGAACEFVYEGLLPSEDSDLTSDITAGTAYPRGYRIKKASVTSKTYTASKWTFVDIDINGDFQYSEVAIGGATPSVATNSIRLARVSTDGTTVLGVQDLRATSCTTGTFSGTVSETGSDVSLDDVLKTGTPVRRSSLAGRSPQGFAQGAFVSWDTHTTFKVTPGSLYINGKYRFVTSDTTITTAADTPSSGISGLDTGTVTGGPLRYYVYGVADQDLVETYSVSYSLSGTAPSGLTNYRLIGAINTDATNLFTSRDVVTAHGISERELIGAWINFDGTGTPAIKNAFNVSALADNGTGDYTLSWDADFNNTTYAITGMGLETNTNYGQGYAIKLATTLAVGSVTIRTYKPFDGLGADSATNCIIALGDTRK